MGCGCKTASWILPAVTAATTTELLPLRGCDNVSMQVTFATAAPTAADIVLEGSIDGNTWTSILAMDETDTTAAVESKTVDGTAALPVTRLRVRIHTVTINTCTGITVAVAAS